MDNLQELLEEQEKYQKDDSSVTAEEEAARLAEEATAEAKRLAEEARKDDSSFEEEEGEEELVLVEAKNRFKQIIGLDEDIPNLELDTIADLVKNKLDKVTKAYNDPEIERLVEWKAKGNNLESFFQAPVVFNKASVDIEKDGDLIIETVLKSRGFSEEEVKDNLDLLSLDTDKKTKRINEYMDILEATSKKEYEDYVASVEQSNKDAIEKATQIEKVISENKIGLVNIPKEELNPFMSYLNSNEYNDKWKSLTPEQLAYIEYLVYKDCNIANNKQQTVPPRKSVQVIVTGSKQQNKSEDVEEQLALLKKFGI